MFNGYDMKKERGHILVCVQNALASSPSFDPIGRTEYFETKARAKLAEKLKGGKGGKDGGSKDEGSPPDQELDESMGCIIKLLI
jgi:hypothetical protein